MLIKRKSIEQAESSRRPNRKPRFAPITLSEHDNVRYLHFGTEWVQGAMRIRKPDWPELEYAQQMMAWMLFLDEPKAIVQLGLGTGALTKFCYRSFPQAKVTAVELNPAVIEVCYSMFKLPPDDARLKVAEGDAEAFVEDPGHHGKFDVIQSDLYDATARGPVLDSPEFYQACAACLKKHGVMTVNLFGDHPSFKRNLKALRFAFADVICLPQVHDGNVVALCFKSRPRIDLEALASRAAAIQAETKLPAKSWVKGIETALQPE
jgi:spermidine synthase